jgi:hypothetical protein
MKGLWRRIRGALGLGVIWAGGGAFIGGLIELISNIFPGLPLYFIDMWIPTLAVPGFLGGVIFSTVLGIAARRRRFDELSLPLVAALGAAGGVLLGGLMVALGVTPLIIVPATLLSGLGACLSLGFARMAERSESISAGDDVDDVGLTAREQRDMLG